jgi:GNAT superfamily N-acetyltransferase
MQYRSTAPPASRDARSRATSARTRTGAGGPQYRPRVGSLGRGATVAALRGRTFGVEYLVRAARVTDIDRLVALSDADLRSDRAASPLDAADLLRQLVYLPQASIFVAETARQVVGGAVLALRPSVRAGGFVGTIDLLVVDPDHDADRVTAALLEEVIRSASNKGCTVVEAIAPDDSAAARWIGQGFTQAGPRIQRPVAAAGSAARRS